MHLRGIKTAKIMPKIANVSIFGHFRPLRGIKQKHFCLVEEVLSFNLWVICENPLGIGFRNEYLTFKSENEVDPDDLHILKIDFKNGLGISLGNFLQNFSQHFPQHFPSWVLIG